MAKYILTGVKEIDDNLQGLKAQVSHKVLQQGNAFAAKSLVNKAKLMAPEGPTGNLIDSIGTVMPSVRASDAIGEVHVGPRRRNGFKGQAGHLVEFGTKRRNNNGANRGVMPKRPFMEPAFENVKDQMISGIASAIARKFELFLR